MLIKLRLGSISKGYFSFDSYVRNSNRVSNWGVEWGGHKPWVIIPPPSSEVIQLYSEYPSNPITIQAIKKSLDLCKKKQFFGQNFPLKQFPPGLITRIARSRAGDRHHHTTSISPPNLPGLVLKCLPTYLHEYSLALPRKKSWAHPALRRLVLQKGLVNRPRMLSQTVMKTVHSRNKLQTLYHLL